MIRAALRELGGGEYATSEDLEVEVQGWFDLSGLRSDADLLVWLTGPTLPSLQHAYERLRASDFGRCIEPVWSNAANLAPHELLPVYEPAVGGAPKKFITVYPVNRSERWYQQPESHQHEALTEWGSKLNSSPDSSVTVGSALGLGDYDWISVVEADDLTVLAQQIHEIRTVRSSMHVRAETPVFTGTRIELADWADFQPQSDFDLE